MSSPARRRLTTGFLAVALTVLTACTSQSAEEVSGGFVAGTGLVTVVDPADRQPAPEVSGPGLDGQPIALSDYAGKTVVLNVWGSWCSPCRPEVPEFDQVYSDLRGDGVQFLGVAIREDASATKAFVDAHDVSYPSISDPSSSTLLGFASSLPAAAVPTTYVIDPGGRIAARILGPADATTVRTLIADVQGVVQGKGGRS